MVVAVQGAALPVGRAVWRWYTPLRRLTAQMRTTTHHVDYILPSVGGASIKLAVRGGDAAAGIIAPDGRVLAGCRIGWRDVACLRRQLRECASELRRQWY